MGVTDRAERAGECGSRWGESDDMGERGAVDPRVTGRLLAPCSSIGLVSSDAGVCV